MRINGHLVKAPFGVYRGRTQLTERAGLLLEHHLAVDLARRVAGGIEVCLACGRADVANDSDVFEVEPIGHWRDGLRQVLAYAMETGLRPNLALFGDRAGAEDIYLVLRDRFHGRVRLWLHGAPGWEMITNRQHAKRKLRSPDLGVLQDARARAAHRRFSPGDQV